MRARSPARSRGGRSLTASQISRLSASSANSVRSACSHSQVGHDEGGEICICCSDSAIDQGAIFRRCAHLDACAACPFRSCSHVPCLSGMYGPCTDGCRTVNPVGNCGSLTGCTATASPTPTETPTPEQGWVREDTQKRLCILRDRLNILNTGSSDKSLPGPEQHATPKGALAPGSDRPNQILTHKSTASGAGVMDTSVCIR